MLYPVQSVSAVVGRATFPGFSQIQTDKYNFRNIFLIVVYIALTVNADWLERKWIITQGKRI